MIALKACALVVLVGTVLCMETGGKTNDHSMDPNYYRCPFSMFDAGMPVTEENGEVRYCDVDGVQCPTWYFCSYGYEDNRSVCCHILGV